MRYRFSSENLWKTNPVPFSIDSRCIWMNSSGDISGRYESFQGLKTFFATVTGRNQVATFYWPP